LGVVDRERDERLKGGRNPASLSFLYEIKSIDARLASPQSTQIDRELHHQARGLSPQSTRNFTTKHARTGFWATVCRRASPHCTQIVTTKHSIVTTKHAVFTTKHALAMQGLAPRCRDNI
jgi:hypothetical protein